MHFQNNYDNPDKKTAKPFPSLLLQNYKTTEKKPIYTFIQKSFAYLENQYENFTVYIVSVHKGSQFLLIQAFFIQVVALTKVYKLKNPGPSGLKLICWNTRNRDDNSAFVSRWFPVKLPFITQHGNLSSTGADWSSEGKFIS